MRAYVFVERHLSSIDKGIQAAHALVEYQVYKDKWKKWSGEDKTLILLDGGTAKDLEALAGEMKSKGIEYGLFKEPDLNDCVTAVCVIVDERVYDKEKYPSFEDWLTIKLLLEPSKYSYEKWMETLGGKENVYLRELITNKRLAR